MLEIQWAVGGACLARSQLPSILNGSKPLTLMRIIGEIPHPTCRITLFSWNLKYLIKLEKGLIEQTFKVPQLEVTGDEDVKNMLKGEFLEEAIQRFDEMEASLMKALSEG